MIKMKYKYTNKDTYNQYEGKKFEIGKPVGAIYVKSPVESDNGNPFIEALPKPRLDDEIDRDYEFGIKGYNTSPKNEFQALTEMQLLREIRFKLPFFKSLEIEHYNCLVNSYRAREFMANEEYCKVIGNTYGAASVGYNLLGYSGSGKSSALKILLSRYPQVINHHFKVIGDFKQITYIYVSTSPNDNFRVLFDSMAKAIDNALGFTEPFYEQLMYKRKSLGGKAAYIETLIEKFSIGMILNDEIQLMSFNSTKENSFTTLAKLANDCKVCVSLIGLPEAMEKMFKKEWTARRVGTTINSSAYCDNYPYFNLIFTKLTKYNWLKHPLIITDDGLKAIFDYTNGAIAHIVSFYMRLQLDYLDSDKQVTLDSKCVEKIMNKYFNGLIKILSKRSKQSKKTKDELKVSEFERMRAIENNDLKLNADIQAKLQEVEMQKQIIGEKAYEDALKKAELEKYVVDTILIFNPEKDTNVIKGCLKRTLSKNKSSNELTKEEMLQLVLKEMNKKKTKQLDEKSISVPRMI